MPRKTKRRNNKGRGSSSSSASSIKSNSLIDGTRSLIQSGKIKISSASDNNSNKSDTLGDTIAIGGISIIALVAVLLSLRTQGFLRHI
jgi:hypothetical protein